MRLAILTTTPPVKPRPTVQVDDIAALQPAMFIGVPRVFDRIYTGISTQVGAWNA